MSKVAQLQTVLTGDLVRSRKAEFSDIRSSFDALASASRKFGHLHLREMWFTRHRGDGWQVLVDRPQLTLDAIIYFIASLKSVDSPIETRIGAGVGTIARMGEFDLRDASGQAFFVAGDALDQMSPKRTLAIAGTGITPALDALVALTEFISSGWTRAQAEAVALAVIQPDATHDAIARQLGITRQAVQSRLASAGFAYLEKAIYAFETHDFTSG